MINHYNILLISTQDTYISLRKDIINYISQHSPIQNS